eukprot:COSAG02_NODE_2668_length_8293_cov_23.094825_3_plen_166_part_00
MSQLELLVSEVVSTAEGFNQLVDGSAKCQQPSRTLRKSRFATEENTQTNTCNSSVVPLQRSMVMTMIGRGVGGRSQIAFFGTRQRSTLAAAASCWVPRRSLMIFLGDCSKTLDLTSKCVLKQSAESSRRHQATRHCFLSERRVRKCLDLPAIVRTGQKEAPDDCM